MDNSLKSSHRGEPVTSLDNASNDANLTKFTPKINRLLIAFVRGVSLNRFEAEVESGVEDHVLPTTVSEIQKRLGLSVTRMRETVSGYSGKPTYVCRYWLTEKERERARQLLGMPLSEVSNDNS